MTKASIQTSSILRAIALMLIMFSSIAFRVPVRHTFTSSQPHEYKKLLLSRLNEKLRGKQVHMATRHSSLTGVVKNIHYTKPTGLEDEDVNDLVLTNLHIQLQTPRTTYSVPLADLSGVTTSSSDYPNSHLVVTESSHDSDIRVPADLLAAGFPNIVLDSYDDGYLEVFVEGVMADKKTAGILLIKADDILRSETMKLAKGAFRPRQQ